MELSINGLQYLFYVCMYVCIVVCALDLDKLGCLSGTVFKVGTPNRYLITVPVYTEYSNFTYHVSRAWLYIEVILSTA